MLLTAPALLAQTATVRPVDPLWMPGIADSNSPVHWRQGNMFMFNSNGMPVLSLGPDLTSLRATRAVLFYSNQDLNKWIEATWLDPDGNLWAWYHHEVFLDCGPGVSRSAPVIGALVSLDGGATFFELGVVAASGATPNCAAENGYFGGGHGDFTVVPDEQGEYLYFYFSNYGGSPSSQGVAVARMRMEDRYEPVGHVWKYHNGAWEEPGLYGDVTPIFPATVDWGQPNTDAFWGPSVHFNTALGKYVMLMNRSCCSPGWPQEGIYISFGSDPADPESWRPPERLPVDYDTWYPQVVGTEPGETDKRAGRVSRLFVGAYSQFELVLENEPPLDPPPPPSN